MTENVCCICHRGPSDGIVLMTLRVKNQNRVTACPDDLRQAISQSDIKPLTDTEWRQLGRNLIEALEAETEGEPK